MAFPKQIRGCELESFNTYTTELQPVGTKMCAEDGRIYRFTGVGAVTVVGSVYQAPLWDVAKYGAQACGTIAAGKTVITGVGATTASFAVDKLIYGYFWVDSAADKSPAMRVKDNTAIVHNAADDATNIITLFNKTRLAIAAASTCSYVGSVWRDPIISVAPQTAPLAGVCVKIIAASSFGWFQTGGACRVLFGDVPVAGDFVANASGVSGSVRESTDYHTDGPDVGNVQFVQINTEFGLIHLTMDKNR